MVVAVCYLFLFTFRHRCFDTVDQITGGSSSPLKICATYPWRFCCGTCGWSKLRFICN